MANYLKRWAIELLIKDQKQQSGLADYRVLRYRAGVRHLHRVDAAYAWGPHLHSFANGDPGLTHLALTERSPQGQRKNQNALRLPRISQIQTRIRQVVWREAVEDVVKHSHERPVLRRLEKPLAA